MDGYDTAGFATAYLSDDPRADYDNVPGLNYPGDLDAFPDDWAECDECE